MKKLLSDIVKPAPLWFRVLNRVWTPAENIVLIALAFKYPENSQQYLFAKMASSFVRQLLDAILVEAGYEK